MVEAPNAIRPLVFNDFTPGIADNPGTKYPVAQATRANTYRCHANLAGALVPLPRNDYTHDGTLFEVATPNASNGYFCSGIFAAGPVVPATGAASTRPHELWVFTEYSLTTPKKKRKIERWRLFEASPTLDVILANEANVTTDATVGYGVTFDQTRANHADPTLVGIPVAAISWGSSIATNSANYEFPDDTTPTSNTPKSIHTDLALVVCHQGRFVYRYLTGYGRGSNGSWSTTEDLKWAPVNDPQGTLSILQAFYPEQTDGYALMATMSANELFCLKEQGALVLLGDLDNPTVTNLPMVIGSGGVAGSQGLRTPIGFLYATRDGIHTWTHGDTAELISPAMIPNFYQVGEEEHYLSNAYSWCINGDLIYLSNNFIFDLRTKSYWRLEDESVMKFRWMTTFRNFVYGARSTYTNASPALVRGYNTDSGAVSYSWQSQPIWESVDRIIINRSVELIAQGQGTVTLSLTTLSGSTSSVTITLANTGYPEIFRRNLAVQGTYVKLRIEAASGDNSVNAPTVHSVILNIEERAPLATV